MYIYGGAYANFDKLVPMDIGYCHKLGHSSLYTKSTGPGRLTRAGFWRDAYGRLNGADARRPKRRVVAALIAHRTPCSDFRLTSHVSHNRTERALQLAFQHLVAGAAVLVLPELSSSHAPHGAIVCG